MLKLTCIVEPVGLHAIKHGFDRPLADELTIDTGDDPAAGYVREHFIFELSRICTASAHEIAIEPLLGDALELTEQMKFRILTRISPSMQHKVRS